MFFVCENTKVFVCVKKSVCQIFFVNSECKVKLIYGVPSDNFFPNTWYLVLSIRFVKKKHFMAKYSGKMVIGVWENMCSNRI